MTSNDAQADDRITSRSWVGDYAKQNESGEAAAPTIPSANVFTEGGAPEDAVPIPSMDPALHLSIPGSRMSTLDTFRLSSLDSRMVGAPEDAVPIPSMDPALHFSIPGSRMSTLDTFRLSSLDSRMVSVDLQKSGSSLDWLHRIFGDSAFKPSDGVSTMDLITSAVEAEEEPPLSPEHETEEPSSVAAMPVAKRFSRKTSGRREYVAEVRQWDILSERGGKANHHDGNKRYRKVVSEMKAQYRGIESKTAKTDLSRAILDYIANYGGRFLKKEKNGRYYEMTKQEARKKTSQALREVKTLKWTQVEGVEDHVDV